MDLYFDCFSGISGDMTLGAFMDLGVPLEFLKDELRRMPLHGFDISVKDVSKHGIRAKDVHVQEDHHVHAMNYTDIKALISESPFSERVRRMSLSIFEKIADAESEIHGCPKDKVHFHEVGGIDAMVDIVGTALCVDYLNIETIRASALPQGSGFVTCAHGTLPIPAPATVKILEGIPVYGTPVKKELVTPTGAAIIASLAGGFGDMPMMSIIKTAYGAGKRDLEDRPNLLRVIAGVFTDGNEGDERITVLESTIDDMNPEHYGHLMDRLLDDGALDVLFQPVYMKKNRPGIVVSVFCREQDRGALTHRILTETTSTGVRYSETRRTILPRTAVEIDTPYGKIAAKRIERPDGTIHVTPEFEAARRIALDRNVPLRHVYAMVDRMTGEETP
jgi:uncharacterized protein (TIGR00299 family) protein